MGDLLSKTFSEFQGPSGESFSEKLRSLGVFEKRSLRSERPFGGHLHTFCWQKPFYLSILGDVFEGNEMKYVWNTVLRG